MRSFVSVSVMAFVLGGCHQPEAPPPMTPTPIDPMNMRLAASASVEPGRAAMLAVIDASIVTEAGRPLDASSFELDAGVSR